MRESTSCRGTASLDVLFDSLASQARRSLLDTLWADDTESATLESLAIRQAAGPGQSPAEVTDARHERARASLHHVHLPKLDTAGLIEYDTDRGTVTPLDHPARRDSGVRAAIEGATTANPASLDALFEALATGRNRRILDVLSHQLGAIPVETLARELGATDLGAVESDVDAQPVDHLRASLRHHHLPHLAAADLVEYDPDASIVAYAGHPDLLVPWMHSVHQPDFRASLTDTSDDQEITTVEGRERVVSFGQSLCDRADDELFCMFTDTDLLEAGCLTRIRDAASRGVDVYLGTCDPAIHDYIDEHAPAVVHWEPRSDWLDVPVEGDRVGRLILADREAVMLGTLGEETDADHAAERAVVAGGADNTMVVMVGQLLQSRLDRLAEDPGGIEAVRSS